MTEGARYELYDDRETLLQASDAFTKLFVVIRGQLAASLGQGDSRQVLEFLTANPGLARRFEEAIDVTDRALASLTL